MARDIDWCLEMDVDWLSNACLVPHACLHKLKLILWLSSLIQKSEHFLELPRVDNFDEVGISLHEHCARGFVVFPQQRADDALLALLPPDVVVQDAEDDQRMQLDGQRHGGLPGGLVRFSHRA